MPRTKVFGVLKTKYSRSKSGEGRNEDRRKDYLLRLKFNLTLDEYLAMLVAQDYRCAICQQLLDITGGRRKKLSPHVDHNHVNGKVRGILCARCNNGIGLLQDDPLVVEAALAYLKKYI